MTSSLQSMLINHRTTWWRRWYWGVAAAVLSIFLLLGFSCLSTSPDKTTSFTLVPDMVPLTLLRNAKLTGAFCLDGSLPGYHFQKGFGSGSGNWLLHLQGGAWCNTIASCSDRKTTAFGSSKFMEHEVQFPGILSSDPSQNPDFYSWNKVVIRYCDGASFAGHPESEFNNSTKLFFRGQLIWEAAIDELLSLGLSNARQALLTGCSAGGLATLIHCDDFRDILPKDAKVKCLSDAGFFLNEKDIAGNHTIQSYYHDVVQLQGVSNSLNKDCVAKKDPFKCFFPQEFTSSIKTPVFLVNSAYDSWQIPNILVPVSSDSSGEWFKCRLDIHSCSPSQIGILQDFRNSLLKALNDFLQINGGVFINSCFIHCQTLMAETWHGPASPKINNKTIAESVGEWYFGDKIVQQVDCPYPCNPTCNDMESPFMVCTKLHASV
ncbi:Pectin acetylesterase [Heracleum sosnowskyi]|uniref:Pectin acetylesterase n=1 Tax=Heracleum sosnowskyi TaxID=360622 RepID=A0AAD8IYA7_9APIA|nr:Pectin acetylesterase [Heracleum sosnowskyi]